MTEKIFKQKFNDFMEAVFERTEPEEAEKWRCKSSERYFGVMVYSSDGYHAAFNSKGDVTMLMPPYQRKEVQV
ncbi:MAG: hypothetical protein LUB83_00115 [Prevotellaceae bacterium]|nr:hypothetical protein [Prevotellaceae bacterium]